MLSSIKQLKFHEKNNLPELVPLKSGELVYSNGDSIYVLFVFITGSPGEVGKISDEMMKNVGFKMAKLHRCQNGKEILKPLLDVGLHDHIEFFIKKEIILKSEYIGDPFIDYLHFKLEFIKNLTSREDISWSVIHADICPSNIIFNNDDARFIDCEFLCYYPCLLDIGVAVTQCCTDNNWNSSDFTFRSNQANVFMQGYISQKSLTDIEIELLNDFSCLGAILFAYLCYRMSTLLDNVKLKERHKLWWNVANYFENRPWKIIL
jgi:Ser/Thr protein kinase RdoA (MazF antagonist)